MDLQAAKLMQGTRPQWARLAALILFTIAAALLVSSLADGSGSRRSEAAGVVAQT